MPSDISSSTAVLVSTPNSTANTPVSVPTLPSAESANSLIVGDHAHEDLNISNRNEQLTFEASITSLIQLIDRVTNRLRGFAK